MPTLECETSFSVGVARVLTQDTEKCLFYVITAEKRTCWSWKSANN